MDWIATHAGEDLARFGLGRNLYRRRANRPLWSVGERGGPVDPHISCVLVRVGTVGLLALPILMLASVLVHAPLAGPAAISLGYFGAARAVASRNDRGAHAWGAAVFGGLALWILVVVGLGERPLSVSAIAGALLAVAFAAGPAVLRRLRGAEQAGDSTATGLPAMPAECNAPPEPRAAVRCHLPGGTVHFAGRGETVGSVTMDGSRTPDGDTTPLTGCDVGEALAFAVRLCARKAAARNVTVVAECAGDVLAGCDQQLCRRILSRLIGVALAHSHSGDTVRVLAKRVKGAVLFRVSYGADPTSGAEEAEQSHLFSLPALRQTVEDAGGTLLFEKSRGVERASVRLPESQRGCAP